jgi:hypothetical protein
MLAMATIFLLSILAGYHRDMKLAIELAREVDGRRHQGSHRGSHLKNGG